MAQQRALDTAPLTSLKGVGTQILKRLEKLNIRSVQDLLFHLPLRYENRTQVIPLGQLRPGQHVLVEGRVELCELLAKGRRSLVCRIGDGTGFLNLRFFYFTARQHADLQRGVLLSCFGEVRSGSYGLEMVHPDYHRITGSEARHTESSLTPVYPLTEGIHQKTMRRLINQVFELWQTGRAADLTLDDWIPLPILEALRFPPLFEAVHYLHKPSAQQTSGGRDLTAAHRRLAFEELLAHHLSLTSFRAAARAQRAPLLRASSAATARFRARFPFPLTTAQRRVIGEIEADLAAGKPMLRLVQGDVGAGKTLVAAHAALAALSSGYQVAIMAPTELLAEQHYRTFAGWLEPLGFQVFLLAGKAKGRNRRAVLDAMQSEQPGAVLGTHALFQEQVRFSRLGLIIIDEQHRFGVQQRLALREKGLQDGLHPHQLIMTATPIPRTLAMLEYADLDISAIDELPPGRTPVHTAVIPASRRQEVIHRIAACIAQGRQVYWVCTLIEESEALQCEAAEKTADLLTAALPGIRVALLHGRLNAARKETVMQEFKACSIDLLVATTVIEVGVDVPNASLMIIENAERLGLAQLHQLRGRVGRGPRESHCLLMYQPPLSEVARERLAIVRETSDGFKIAERDLELRGPGEVLGTRQTGQIQFRVADLARDSDLLPHVRAAAAIIRRDYPEHAQPLIRRWLRNAVRYVDA
jgi:ATP-dependent DNA helicase RecG